MAKGMQPLGVGLILAGAYVLRQVSVGRALNIASDTRSLAVALTSFDTNAIGEVFAQRGTSIPAGTTITDTSAPSPTSSLAAEMKRLAVIANNTYVMGAEGPNAYDCSGLVWRALKNLGYYSGARFTTHNFEGVATAFADRDSRAQVGDVVVWPSHHMGVVVGPDLMYSALNRRVGIVTSKISADSQTPDYWTLRPAVPSTGKVIAK